MNATISPEEQIRRVARGLLTLSARPGSGAPGGARPDLTGFIAMIDRHLAGDLPPIEVASEGQAAGPPRRPDASSGR